MPHFSDDLYLGGLGAGAPGGSYAPLGGQLDPANPSPIPYGVGPLGRVYIFDIVPAALSVTAVAAAQAIAGAAFAVLNGASVQTITVPGLGSNPAAVAVMDYDRRLQFVSSNAGDTTQTVLVTGYDRYLQPLSMLVTLNGTTPVVGLKAFKYVTSAFVSAVMVGNLSIGNNDAFGLPFYLADFGYLLSVKWAGVLASDAGTPVVGVTTNPSTTLTGDVRGVYTPSSAANGARRLVIAMGLTGAQSGPLATRASAAGVNQNLYVP